ncbi:LacI family DNA-binding transcriptional regulator [Sphingomonas sp. I4]
MRQSSATIRDVARQAAVSVASVSRAMNGHSSVHPDTRARVMAAAQALGYVPMRVRAACRCRAAMRSASSCPTCTASSFPRSCAAWTAR